MQRIHLLRSFVQLAAVPLMAVLAAPALHAQRNASTLPPTPATTRPVGNGLPAPAPGSPSIGAQTASRPHPAEVTYADGQLDVRADNSSLNQILRSISRLTGLKIAGGVADQRVFGNYGPAALSSVLATLLDGTGTNILLLDGNATTPPTLTLTPRGNAITPPGPFSAIYDAYDGSTGSNAPAAQPVQAGETQPAPSQTQGNSENLPLTPERVAQELLRMQQQKQQKQSASPTPASTVPHP